MSTEYHEPRTKKVVVIPRWFGFLIGGLNVLLVTGAVGALVSVALPFVKAIAQPHEPEMPSVMENVDWHAPDSSKYCLACHGHVGRASGGLAVQRGHEQNVPLRAEQLAVVADMGTTVGPNNTLICMSCHKLNQAQPHPYMLADTLEDSRLCQRCHPGHYAQGTPHDLRQSAPQETNRLGQTAIEGGPCSACHLSHSFAKDLAVSPLDPEGYCLPCHSAYHVAEHHARTTMQHPEARCRECHDPHDATHAEFLAAPPEDICVNCHTGYDDGPAGGMHPVGLTNVDIPPSLQVVESDAHTAMLTCATCHDTHEAPHGTLLRITTASNELCLECHADKLLEHADDGMLPRHGQQPRLDDTQLALVERWGRPVGTGGKLLCVSCHNVHGAVRESQLLAFRPKYGETCGACHPAHEGVVGSPHDMRIDHADLANSAGLLPTEAGVCSPCHMAHQFPRERVATTGDPAGQCISCHRDGDCGQHTYTGLRDHPETSCIDCHDPHVRTFGSFLKAEPARLCAQCHPDHQRLRGGPHDVLTGRGPWPAEATKSQDACLSCHLPHGGTRDDLFRFRVPTGAGNHDGVCLSCHEDAAWQVDSTKAAIHPRTIDPAHAKVDLALVPTDSTGEKRMGCRTCHDPHGGATPTYLARVPIGEDTQRLCVHCHTSKRLTRFTGHSSASLRAAGYEADSCKPCHAMHAKPNDQWGRLLSPRFLMEIRPAATRPTCRLPTMRRVPRHTRQCPATHLRATSSDRHEKHDRTG